MAQHKSAKKRARQDLVRRARNRQVISRVRTLVKQLGAAVDAGDDSVGGRMRSAEKAIRRAASKGIIPKRRASRNISRLARRAHGASSS